ncbi:unnamed protein product, partial [Polarella glacialis]
MALMFARAVLRGRELIGNSSSRRGRRQAAGAPASGRSSGRCSTGRWHTRQRLPDLSEHRRELCERWALPLATKSLGGDLLRASKNEQLGKVVSIAHECPVGLVAALSLCAAVHAQLARADHSDHEI